MVIASNEAQPLIHVMKSWVIGFEALYSSSHKMDKLT